MVADKNRRPPISLVNASEMYSGINLAEALNRRSLLQQTEKKNSLECYRNALSVLQKLLSIISKTFSFQLSFKTCYTNLFINYEYCFLRVFDMFWEKTGSVHNSIWVYFTITYAFKTHATLHMLHRKNVLGSCFMLYIDRQTHTVSFPRKTFCIPVTRPSFHISDLGIFLLSRRLSSDLLSSLNLNKNYWQL